MKSISSWSWSTFEFILSIYLLLFSLRPFPNSSLRFPIKENDLFSISSSHTCFTFSTNRPATPSIAFLLLYPSKWGSLASFMAWKELSNFVRILDIRCYTWSEGLLLLLLACFTRWFEAEIWVCLVMGGSECRRLVDFGIFWIYFWRWGSPYSLSEAYFTFFYLGESVLFVVMVFVAKLVLYLFVHGLFWIGEKIINAVEF